jgi:hypothetical protein
MERRATIETQNLAQYTNYYAEENQKVLCSRAEETLE